MEYQDTDSIEPIMRALVQAALMMVASAQRAAGGQPLQIQIRAGDGAVSLTAEPWADNATPQHQADLAGVEVPDSLPEDLD